MLQSGTQLGDFAIVRPLGRGGMGEVYEALQGHPPRPVALKVLPPGLAGDADARERFRREAEVCGRLDHPNIVPIYANGVTEDGRAYYAMRLVNGLSLAQLIRHAAAGEPPTVMEPPEASETPCPVPAEDVSTHSETPPCPTPRDPPAVAGYRRDRFGTTVRLGVQAARALAHAHRQGVLHRDLKPSNLMVDQHDHLYVVDFGLTLLLGPDGDQSLPGLLRGTPWFMSPEQARGERLDERSDIYGLGVTLYELASGGLGPFVVDRRDSEAVLEAVRQARVLPLRHFAPDVPPELERVILRAMCPRREERYRSAADLAAALEALRPGAEAPPPPVPSPSRAAEGEPRAAPALPRPKGRWWLRLGIASAVVAVLAAVLFWAGRPGAGADALWEVYPEPLPPDRASREPLKPVSLFRLNHAPIWASTLWGEGKYGLHPWWLIVSSPATDDPGTLIALDDPREHWFQFDIGINRIGPGAAGMNQKGVFFGWHRSAADPTRHDPFFVIRLDETPRAGAPDGVLEVGTAWLEKAVGARARQVQWLLPDPKRTLPLGKPDKGWHTVQVRAQDHQVTITADKGRQLEFDVRQVGQELGVGHAGLDARGALGVWAFNGTGHFGNGSVAILPSREGR
jgi:serine/threonine protein kinase